EGWYVLHQAFSLDAAALRALPAGERAAVASEAAALLAEWEEPEGGGGSAAFRLVGGGADCLFVHFRPTLEELGDAQGRLRRSRLGDLLRLGYDFLSVTEAGLYHATAQSAAEAEPGSEAYTRALAERLEAERGSA